MLYIKVISGWLLLISDASKKVDMKKDWRDFLKILNSVWLVFQDQILGMKWLNSLIGKLLSTIKLDMSSRLSGSIQFFVYDVVKITILLCLLIFSISYIESYFPPERSRKILGRFHGIEANIISALLGTVTPFCSCSSIPLFIGFTSAGLPLGVTFSFLISSPMVDLGSFVLLMSIFGAKIALAYVIVGLVIAVIGGTLIEKNHMENYLEDFVKSAGGVDISSPTLTKKDRIRFAKERVLETFQKVFPYIFTILAFMMAVTTLSLPSMIMLKKAVKPKLLVLFIAICTIGIIIVGYIFNIFNAFLI